MQTIQPSVRDEAMIQRRGKDERDLVLLDLETAKNRPDAFNFHQYMTNTISYLGYLVAADPFSPEICWVLNLLCSGIEALFAAAATSQAQIAVVLDDTDGRLVELPTSQEQIITELDNTGARLVELPRYHVYDDAGLNYWEIGFYAAVILRRRKTLDALAALSLEISRSSEFKFDECRYLHAQALQCFWQRKPACDTYLLAAMKAADPSTVVIAPDYIAHIFEWEMELFFRILKHDAQVFNTTLFKALTDFKSYWEKDERRVHPRGLVAFPLLAYAALAYDLGIPIEVESAYIPANLYSGTCR